MEYICRYCLSKKELLYIFSNNDGNDNIIELSSKCLNIQIHEEDEYPKYICKICLNKLKTCYTFYKQTVWSLTYLRKLILHCRGQQPTDNDDSDYKKSLMETKIRPNIYDDPIDDSKMMVEEKVYDANTESTMICPYCDEWFQNLKTHICRVHFDIDMDEEILELLYKTDKLSGHIIENPTLYELTLCTVDNPDDDDVDRSNIENDAFAILLKDGPKPETKHNTTQLNKINIKDSIESRGKDDIKLQSTKLCPYCKNCYANLKKHIAHMHQGIPENEECRKIISHTPNALLRKCPFCKGNFRNLTRHIRSQHKFKPDGLNQKDNQYYDNSVKLCPYCNKECDNFNRHIHEEHPQVESDDYKLQLRKLKSEETLSEAQTCKICCMSLIHIDKHMKMHPPDKFYLFDKIKKNVENGIVLPTRDYCGLCNNVFDNILEHFHKCHLDIVYCKIPKVTSMKVCSVCGLEVLRISKHMRKHSEKRLICDICQKAFSSKQYLEQHMKIHLNTREFKCNICPKAFNTSKSLYVHMHSHTGIRRHKCDLCDKCFTESCHLTRHKKIAHEKTYSVQCRFCDNAFFHRSQATKHEKRYHKNLLLRLISSRTK